MSDRRVSIHEAAHAVAAEVLRSARSVDRVSILPDPTDGSGGRVKFLAGAPTSARCFEDAIVFAVGALAEARATGEPYEPSRSDLLGTALNAALSRLTPDTDPVRALGGDRVMRLAHAILAFAWPAIEEVAAALVAVENIGSIDGEIVRAVVAKHRLPTFSALELDEIVRRTEREAMATMARILGDVRREQLPRRSA